MLNTNRKTLWYGKLDTPNFSNTVLFDPELPEPPKGKLYLYNYERGQVVQYVQDLVSPRLRDLTEQELSELQDAVASQWEGIKRDFIKAHTIPSRSAPASAPASRGRSFDDDFNDGDDSGDDFGGDFDLDLDD
jgi:hypothetical protein